MDDRGTPINNCPSIGGKDLDLYKLFNVVHKLNGYNRVTNRNQWKNVSTKLGLGITASIITQVLLNALVFFIIKNLRFV